MLDSAPLSFRFRWLAVLALALAAATAAPAPAQDETTAADSRLDWWREARFGLFLHWGLYAVPAGEWQGQTGHGEWIMDSAQIPVPVYERFLERFDPVDFDANEWVLAAKAAGMKYIVITSKHHDGFALFDSKVSDYDVMATPFRRDILKELAEACARHGLRMCWYHSIMDWHHPDYLPRRGWEQGSRPAAGADFDRYVEYLHAQVTELLTNYGPIGVMWFDGEWEGTWNHGYGQPLYDLCRRLQPDVIVNNRVDKGRGGMAGMNTGPGFAGDYGTPEQEIPATGLPGVDWETCMTMNRHWGFNRNDHDYKSSTELVRMLCDIASKGGNFLLNVGPTAQGRLPEESLQRLREIGEWMDGHGEAIHGTSASPFPALPWGRCTVRREGDRTRLYLIVFDWPRDGRLVVPGIGNRPVGARLLGAAPDAELSVERAGPDLIVRLPGGPVAPHASVVELSVAGAPVVYLPPAIDAASARFVRAARVTMSVASPELEIRYTLDDSEPDASSPRYETPFELTATSTVRARTFHDGAAVSGVSARRFERVAPRPAVQVFAARPGLALRVYLGDWDALPDFAALTPATEGSAATIGLPPGPAGEFEARVFDGFLEVPGDDLYVFDLVSDDGARLWLDGELVVDHDGLHATSERRGDAPLAGGLHPLRVEWFNKTGGAELELRMGRAGQSSAPVPAAAFSR